MFFFFHIFKKFTQNRYFSFTSEKEDERVEELAKEFHRSVMLNGITTAPAQIILRCVKNWYSQKLFEIKTVTKIESIVSGYEKTWCGFYPIHSDTLKTYHFIDFTKDNE